MKGRLKVPPSISLLFVITEILKNSGSVMSTLRTFGGTRNIEGKDASQLIVDDGSPEQSE